MSKRGLPTGLQMRHDSHYVEELAKHRPTQIGRLIAIDKIDPNPEQPRTEIGDLTELTASISEKGVLEPLLVKPSRLTGRWMIIAGERRWRAATAAGLSEVPCIEMEVDDKTVAEIALIENMQRKDLTIWEEADGLLSLCERFGYTHDEVARKVGKSRTTVSEIISIAHIPQDVRDLCREAGIAAKSVLLQLVRQPDDESMRRLATQITSQGLTREEVREVRRQESGPRIVPEAKPYTFRYAPPQKDFSLEIKFRRANVSEREVAEALRITTESVEEELLANSALSGSDASDPTTS
ncbi:MAG: Chromosome (Plasmid) partitioning protein ParB/stage 0 sporulation protein [Acidobacteria bacterium]|nr:Chromosome (Plasmid) partitioning protein ParB/stage 0 sporulation protein [Acidobacteriota bacterium]